MTIGWSGARAALVNPFPDNVTSGMRIALFLFVAISVAGCLAPYKPPRPEEPEPAPLPPPRISPSGATLQDQVSGTTQRLQAVSVVDPNIVWASGTGGTFAVTHNGGQSWRTGVVAGADSLEFRDVEAFDGHVAYLLSAGNGTQSRIYKTEDGGVNWQLQFINRDSLAFYDCLAFWDQRSGIAFSDNVRGVFPIIYTDNGGADWDFLSDPSNPSASPVPAATPGEGAFAASGTCLTTVGKEAAFIATGAGTEARILSTTDRGQTWSQVTTPIVQGTPTTGHTSVAFRNGRDGIAVGGDIGKADGETDNVVRTADEGLTWTLGGRPTFTGAIFGAAYVPGTTQTVVAVGPKGASVSADDGLTWQPLDSLPYWSAGFASRAAGWLVGPGGHITKVSF
jgi:photosystem II stability/assembly factor-like uncharacterized protein